MRVCIIACLEIVILDIQRRVVRNYNVQCVAPGVNISAIQGCLGGFGLFNRFHLDERFELCTLVKGHNFHDGSVLLENLMQDVDIDIVFDFGYGHHQDRIALPGRQIGGMGTSCCISSSSWGYMASRRRRMMMIVRGVVLWHVASSILMMAGSTTTV